MTSWNRHSFSAKTYTMWPKSQKSAYIWSHTAYFEFFIFRLSIAKLCLLSCWEYKNVQYLNLSLQIKEVFLRADRKYWFLKVVIHLTSNMFSVFSIYHTIFQFFTSQCNAVRLFWGVKLLCVSSSSPRFHANDHLRAKREREEATARMCEE